MDYSTIAKRRNTLLHRAGVLFLLVIAAGAVSFRNTWIQNFLPKPDYYKALMSGLAHQTSLTTGVTTIVKEDDNAREFFLEQYQLKKDHFALSSGDISIGQNQRDQSQILNQHDNNLLDFWYIHDDDLTGTPMETVRKLRFYPERVLNQPSGQPVALWVFSRKQNVLVTIFYEAVDKNVATIPRNHMVVPLTTSGAVDVEGTIPPAEVMPFSAYLVPLGDMKVENLAWNSKDDPDLRRFDYALPLYFSSNLESKVVRPHPSDTRTIQELRTNAAWPFLLVRGAFRYLIVPVSLFWLVMTFRALRRSHLAFLRNLSALSPEEFTQFTFLPFLYADLYKQLDDMRQARQKSLIAKQQQTEKIDLGRELDEYCHLLQLDTDRAREIHDVIQRGALTELRDLRDRYRNLNNHQRQKAEADQAHLREQRREIQRLIDELESIPTEKRIAEARTAWELYQEARAREDPRSQLALLKEARKNVPRELRPDRF